jgi:hypothetical protein
MTFTMEEEIKNNIKFLDVTISNDEHKIPPNVYRKPPATDIIISNDPCHPPEQKLAEIRCLVNIP